MNTKTKVAGVLSLCLALNSLTGCGGNTTSSDLPSPPPPQSKTNYNSESAYLYNGKYYDVIVSGDVPFSGVFSFDEKNSLKILSVQEISAAEAGKKFYVIQEILPNTPKAALFELIVLQKKDPASLFNQDGTPTGETQKFLEGFQIKSVAPQANSSLSENSFQP